MDRPESRLSDAQVWVYLAVSAVALLFVLAAPPLVATVWIIAFTAARPGVIGPWIPTVQVLATASIVVGARVRRPRGSK